MAKKNDKLIQETDKYVMSLLFQASGGTIATDSILLGETSIEFSEKVRCLDIVIKYLQAKNRIDPEPEAPSGFSKLASQLHGGPEIKRGRGKASVGNGIGAPADEDSYPR